MKVQAKMVVTIEIDLGSYPIADDGITVASAHQGAEDRAAERFKELVDAIGDDYVTGEYTAELVCRTDHP